MFLKFVFHVKLPQKFQKKNKESKNNFDWISKFEILHFKKNDLNFSQF